MSVECGYTHDVSGGRFDDIDRTEWTCRRSSAPGADRCLFHAEAGAVDEEAVRERLLAAVAEKEGPVRLIGARLASLALDYAILNGPSNHPIDLREATVAGDLSVRHATLERPLRLEGATLTGTVDFEDATFARRVDFGGATFEGRVSLRMVDARSWLDLRETEFRGPVYARVARFRRGIYGIDATFREAADFLNTRFDDVANFYRATFRAGAVFDSTTFEGNAQFIEATIEAPAIKLVSATGSPRSEAERRDGVALSLDGVTCERDVRLTDATVGGDVVFTDSDLGRDLQSTGLTTTAEPIVVDCTGSSVISGRVTGHDGRITYDVTDAEVAEVDVTGDDSLGVFRFDGTTFGGFDFGAYKRELAARGWRLHDPDADSDPERRENLYLRAKNGAKDIGESRAAAEFFIREMRYRRLGHRQRVGRARSLRDALGAAGSWVSNGALELSCGYGERPFRPLLFSVALIVAFAGVFATFDTPLTYSGPIGYLVFSIEGFVSLILGLPEVTGTALGFVLALEGFVGGFMIALFVFTLTRSVSR